jgi:phosphate transport system permease protein
MVVGSLCLAVAAMGVAYPLGLGMCGFAHGLGPRCLKGPLMGLINFMTSIPTVIYGFVSVVFLVPLVRGAFPESTGYSWLTAALTLSLMILPTIVLLVHAQLQQVDARVRLASAALGFSPAQTLLWVIRPLASRGLWAAAVLGFSRALGDTIIALMVEGNRPAGAKFSPGFHPHPDLPHRLGGGHGQHQPGLPVHFRQRSDPFRGHCCGQPDLAPAPVPCCYSGS